MNGTDVQIRVYPEEKALIRARARHHGRSISEYLGRLVGTGERKALICAAYPADVDFRRPVDVDLRRR